MRGSASSPLILSLLSGTVSAIKNFIKPINNSNESKTRSCKKSFRASIIEKIFQDFPKANHKGGSAKSLHVHYYILYTILYMLYIFTLHSTAADMC